jgi:hypothetical protein
MDISNHRIIVKYSKENEQSINNALSKSLITNNYFKRINETKQYLNEVLK